MTDIDKLIEELEVAERGSSELNKKLWEALPDMRPSHDGWTTSVDAALGLIPEGWQFQLIHTSALPYTCGKLYQASVKPESEFGWVVDPKPHYGAANTLPLAICIAALKARKEKE